MKKILLFFTLILSFPLFSYAQATEGSGNSIKIIFTEGNDDKGFPINSSTSKEEIIYEGMDYVESIGTNNTIYYATEYGLRFMEGYNKYITLNLVPEYCKVIKFISLNCYVVGTNMGIEVNDVSVTNLNWNDKWTDVYFDIESQDPVETIKIKTLGNNKNELYVQSITINFDGDESDPEPVKLSWFDGDGKDIANNSVKGDFTPSGNEYFLHVEPVEALPYISVTALRNENEASATSDYTLKTSDNALKVTLLHSGSYTVKPVMDPTSNYTLSADSELHANIAGLDASLTIMENILNKEWIKDAYTDIDLGITFDASLDRDFFDIAIEPAVDFSTLGSELQDEGVIDIPHIEFEEGDHNPVSFSVPCSGLYKVTVKSNSEDVMGEASMLVNIYPSIEGMKLVDRGEEADYQVKVANGACEYIFTYSEDEKGVGQPTWLVDSRLSPEIILPEQGVDVWYYFHDMEAPEIEISSSLVRSIASTADISDPSSLGFTKAEDNSINLRPIAELDRANTTISFILTKNGAATPMNGAKSSQAILFTKTNQPTGVEEIEAEGESRYYTLEGLPVTNPTKGIFIKHTGNKVLKVVL